MVLRCSYGPMPDQAEDVGYKVWAADDVVYGPVAIPVLADWVRDERVLAGTWVFCVASGRWVTASEIPELRPLLFIDSTSPTSAVSTSSGNAALKPSILRRVRAISELTDDQLQVFSRYVELVRFGAFTPIMRVGGPGDSMFFVLEGQVRLRILVGAKELLISVQESGGVFGQISIFDGMPRITDAISDTEVVLLKLTAVGFRNLCRVHPDIATPMLLALGRTLAGRIRSDDKHLCELMSMNQTIR